MLNRASAALVAAFALSLSAPAFGNGTITGFAAHGIYGEGEHWIVEDMRVAQNGAHGIFVSGIYSTVRTSTIVENGNFGIRCGARCLVEGSISSVNGGAGISLTSGTVLGNVIISNAGVGIDGGSYTGSGNNILAGNNGGGTNPQVEGVAPLHPNVCSPACP